MENFENQTGLSPNKVKELQKLQEPLHLHLHQTSSAQQHSLTKFVITALQYYATMQL
jgi:hypothetical protein